MIVDVDRPVYEQSRAEAKAESDGDGDAGAEVEVELGEYSLCQSLLVVSRIEDYGSVAAVSASSAEQRDARCVATDDRQDLHRRAAGGDGERCSLRGRLTFRPVAGTTAGWRWTSD